MASDADERIFDALLKYECEVILAYDTCQPLNMMSLGTTKSIIVAVNWHQ